MEQSDTPGVRHVECTFPFDAYDASGADRLAIFADWLVQTVARGAPELSIDDHEMDALTDMLAREQYTYCRTDSLKQAAGEPGCEVRYLHAPEDLVITATCKLENGRTISRTLREHPFPRDELVYGRAITRCSLVEGDQLVLETYTGTL